MMMTTMYWHVTVSSVQRFVLLPDETARRRAVRTIDRIARDALLLFALADDHLHWVLACLRERIGRMAGALRNALRPVVAAELEPFHIRPIRTRSHLRWCVDYHLEQPDHHGLPENPAVYTGSCFQDLVGARRLPHFRARILDALPRLRAKELYPRVRLPAKPLIPVTDPMIRAAGPARLVGAASAALAAGPELVGNRAEVVDTRRAVSVLGVAAGIPRREIAWALSVTPRCVAKLLAGPVDTATLRAVRLRLALEEAAGHPLS